MMRRVSAQVLHALLLLTLVIAYDMYFTRREWTEYYQRTFSQHADKLENEALAGGLLFKADHDLKTIATYLESRRRSGDISYWLLLNRNQVFNTSVQAEVLQTLHINVEKPGELVASAGGQNYYIVEQLENDLFMVVGVRYALQEFLDLEFQTQRSVLARYLVGLLIVCGGIFAFFFRDLMRVARGLLNPKNQRGFRVGGGHSREADVLARGLSAFQNQTQDLEKEKQVYRLQILPSLRSELMSGREPPYEFACTLVRTDINNFSKIYNENSVPEFTATINDFFTDVSHVVARYGGYVHEFVGDEVLYYFKDDEVGDSVEVALAAIRDIGQIAGRYHQNTLTKRGYPFTVKSSLAHDQLYFGPLVSGFALSGPSLIETVRVLSQVTEKDGNVVVFAERHRPKTIGLIRFDDFAEVTLKGFSRPMRLLIYGGHEKQETFFDWKNSALHSRLLLYLSDLELARSLRWMRDSWRDAPVNSVLQLIGHFRQIRVTNSDGAPLAELSLWIDELMEECEHFTGDVLIGVGEGPAKILASVLRLIENLTSLATEHQVLAEKILEKAICVKNRRVVANAVDALASLRHENRGWVKELTEHVDNRVSANALVHEGRSEVTSSVIRKLKRMLRSEDPLWLASGLYALGEIARFHRQRDPVYFSTQLELQKFLLALPGLVFHVDHRVRRQAMVAAKKTDDPTLRAQILELAQKPDHVNLSDEVLEFVNAATPSKRAA